MTTATITLPLLIASAAIRGVANAGLPACDDLRACSRDLASEMARCCAWRPETIAQYRRMGSTNFEEAPDASAVCKSTYQTPEKTSEP